MNNEPIRLNLEGKRLFLLALKDGITPETAQNLVDYLRNIGAIEPVRRIVFVKNSEKHQH